MYDTVVPPPVILTESNRLSSSSDVSNGRGNGWGLPELVAHPTAPGQYLHSTRLLRGLSATAPCTNAGTTGIVQRHRRVIAPTGCLYSV